MNDHKEEVVIVGAGPVGLLLGCWLRKLGVGVRVLEKRATRSTQSKAVSMNAYSLAILHALGIYDQFDAVGKRLQDLHLYWQQKRLMHVNYRRLPSKYNYSLCLVQPKTEALLEAHFLASGGILQRGVEVVRLQADSDAVYVYAHHAETGREERLTAQYLVGCDGSKSMVREQLGLSFTGRDHGTGFIMVDGTISWSGDVKRVHYFVSEDAFFILIPLSDDKHRIIIRTPNNDKEKIVGNKLAVYQDLIMKYGPSGLILHDIVWESNTTYHNRLAEHYGYGRVLLAGDASHIFSSIGGLGMNTGFQDALALAWRLAGILRKRFRETVLASYELERRTLTQQLIDSTNQMTALITRVNRDPASLRDWLPIMANRQRLATLPLHFSGLNQRYEKGVLVENNAGLVGRLIPYFKLTHQGKYLCSYDLVDGCYFYLIYGSTLPNAAFWEQYKEVVKLIQLQNPDEWQQVCNCLGLQTEEMVLMRPDGIVAAKAAINNASNVFSLILNPLITRVDSSMKPLLIFDLDGTLADTSPGLVAALNAVLADYNEAPVAPASVLHLISQGVVGLLGGGFGSAYATMPDEKKQALSQAFVAYYEQNMLNEIALYPGIETALNVLSAQGFKMAICSNKNTLLVAHILEHLHIRHHFLAVCGGDFFMGIKKPDRRHVEGTMREAGFDESTAHAIFIGDAMSDVNAAKNTGIPSVFLTYGYADVAPNASGADAVVHHANDLPAVILTLSSSLESEKALA